MRIFATLAAAVLVASASALSSERAELSTRDAAAWAAFVEYAVEYEKEYRSLDNNDALVAKRFGAFKLNLDRIEAHNAKYATGEYSFELGLNHLADLTDAEYKARLTYQRSSSAARHAVSTVSASSQDLPKAWDWREHNVVTPVKNQGQCGSCWAFSAVAALESAYALATGSLESLAEQELVDCVLGGEDTCDHGGEMQDAFDEIITHHGGKIEREADYPYTAVSKGVCKADDSKAIGHFTAYANVTVGDESALQTAVATKGVQSVAIDASSFTFQLYRHGVYSWPLCSSSELDHGVAVAGYGTLKGKDYWLVKNSWSEGWGMKGYILMSRNKKNQCGIATDASYPIMAKQEQEDDVNAKVAAVAEITSVM